MAKCIGNCPACELDVDKVVCCSYQSLKQLLLIRSEIGELKKQIEQAKPDPESSLDYIDIAEPDALGAAEE
ncbi:MAG: hypothetical protein IKV75_01780 [Bacteroidales bacterium]|nr:hypothetical protein [Bacteroidales bacterium]